MTANDLLDTIGSAKESYIQAAAACRQSHTPVRKPKRLWLIAAIIALMVLLMGCALVYFSLQDKVLNAPDPTAGACSEETRAAVALFGYEGNPVFTAAKEWYAYTKSYDPERALYPTEDAQLTFPGCYMEIYDCYTQEMADKAQAIAAENSLRMLSGLALVQREDVEIFLNGLGLTGLHHADRDASVRYGSGYFHPEGNFNLIVDVTLTGENAAWNYGTFATYHYARKDCFDPDYALVDLAQCDQWNYETADGTDLLIAMGAESALLFAETEDAYITVTLTTSPYSDTNPNPTRSALEQLAEVYDFTVNPKIPDWESTTAALKAAEDARAAEANAQTAMEYSGFADFLKAKYPRVRRDVYCGFADVTGDGEPELLLGSADGSFESVLRLTDEGVQESLCHGTFYLCEDGLLENVYLDGYVKGHSWFSLSEAFFFDPYSGSTPPEAVVYHDSRTDAWTDNYPWAFEDEKTQLTQTEAAAILAAHPRQEIPMSSIMQFPLEDGSTLKNYILANEFTVSDEERMSIYSGHLQSIPAELRTERSHYCLLDLNGDGVEDLLVGTEDQFRDALTVHNGQLKAISQWCTMHLCEGSILRITSGNTHTFYRFEEGSMVMVDCLNFDAELSRYNRSADGDDYYEQTLTEAEYEAILESYRVVPLPMTPVSDFSG